MECTKQIEDPTLVGVKGVEGWNQKGLECDDLGSHHTFSSSVDPDLPREWGLTNICSSSPSKPWLFTATRGNALAYLAIVCTV